MSKKIKKKTNPKAKLNRKQLRKDKRKEKKIKRNEYYTKRGKKLNLEIEHVAEKLEKEKQVSIEKKPKKNEDNSSSGNKVLSTEDIQRKEKRVQKKIEKDMSKQRQGQLLKANEKEDETIRKLEKQLKLHKRKSKGIPKSFAEDGLDYLLEVCDPEYMKNYSAAEKDLNDGNDNFDEDFALMTGHIPSQKEKKSSKHMKDEEEADSDFEDFLNKDDGSDDFDEDEDENMLGDYSDDNAEEPVKDEMFDDHSFDTDSENESVNTLNSQGNKSKTTLKKHKQTINSDDDDDDDDDDSEVKPNKKTKKEKNVSDLDIDFSDEDTINKKSGKRKIGDYEKPKSKKSKKCVEFEDNDSENEEYSDVDTNSDSEVDDSIENKDKNVWEDIYGRLRSKDGAVLNNTEGKYIPPAIRAKMEANGPEDIKRKEKLDRLRKQLKGLLNRLAESNMHNIASQIETLYMNNSRNDMSETLTSLLLESLVSTVSTPERLLMEHMLLIAVLHANVGSEVGASFLQTIIKKFDTLSKSNQEIEDKTLDNTVNILAQLYNFKVFDSKLLYEILHKLASDFEEKNIECILHVLRSVGFGLRKDDPLALKNLILELQKQAASASQGKLSNSRVKFLLDVLLAIKNNNVTKIPNYDTTYSEHLKKIMKGFIRKGNYVTALNISLEDLLKADERGKWWVVGSAWTGNIDNSIKKQETVKSDGFSQKLLDLARKQRMNTDTRRDVFCIIMTAEDYLDAFEKLLRLSLKNQQEREIIHVILHCCLQEKKFNPYYAVLAQKFCEYDRKFQMTIKCSVWDKLKTLNSQSGGQLSNLAKLLTHLFIEKGLPISTLKIVEFGELDKVTLRLMRQILLGILLHNDLEAIQGVFEKVAQSDKLKMFRESLRLFIHHFLLRNLKTDAVPEDQKQTLEERAKMVEKILTAKDSRLKL